MQRLNELNALGLEPDAVKEERERREAQERDIVRMSQVSEAAARREAASARHIQKLLGDREKRPNSIRGRRLRLWPFASKPRRRSRKVEGTPLTAREQRQRHLANDTRQRRTARKTTRSLR